MARQPPSRWGAWGEGAAPLFARASFSLPPSSLPPRPAAPRPCRAQCATGTVRMPHIIGLRVAPHRPYALPAPPPPPPLQYAVCHLNVPHIIVLGHTQCGGIKALMSDKRVNINEEDGGFIDSWWGWGRGAYT